MKQIHELTIEQALVRLTSRFSDLVHEIGLGTPWRIASAARMLRYDMQALETWGGSREELRQAMREEQPISS